VSTEPSILFDRVSKKFRRGDRHDSLRDLVPSLVKSVFRTPAPGTLADEEFWALRDVSFEVRPGQALGIIGGNGAGKSTSLKLLTRILRPTTGRASLRGRVGALIEVAAGFHPDLTGMENIFLQGAIMGMTRAETTARLDEIIEFAGVGAFINTQVKRYSSGMNARLGFSIAAHLRPDVLVIDEVLSVGDMAFQQKCVDRMLQFKAEGVAIAFVSHNLQAVSALCDMALHLQQEVVAIGPAPEVIRGYLSTTAGTRQVTDGDVIGRVQLISPAGRSVQDIAPRERLILRVDYDLPAGPTADLRFGVVLRRATDHLAVYNINFHDNEILPPVSAAAGSGGGQRQRFSVDYELDMNVTRGQYYFECHVLDAPTQRFLARLTVAHVTVSETRTWEGIADLGMVARPCLGVRP
jgi:lipopolysaccharide transport system ATP-binding protein